MRDNIWKDFEDLLFSSVNQLKYLFAVNRMIVRS